MVDHFRVFQYISYLNIFLGLKVDIDGAVAVNTPKNKILFFYCHQLEMKVMFWESLEHSKLK